MNKVETNIEIIKKLNIVYTVISFKMIICPNTTFLD